LPQTVKYNQLNPLAKKALTEAEKAMKNSYSPYSHFYVGAALFSPDVIIDVNFWSNASEKRFSESLR